MGDDLDAILKGLGGAGIGGDTGPAGGAGGDVPDELASILGSLQTGGAAAPSVADLAKPVGPMCVVCKKVIAAKAVNAMGATFHVECFACGHCHVPFMGGKFIPRDGKPFCDGCYSELYQVRCQRCSEPITSKCIEVGTNAYHPQCFMCSKCDTPLAGKPFHNHENLPICKPCREVVLMELNKDKEVVTCGKCGRPIYGDFLVIGDKKICPEHFSCKQCGVPLSGGGSFEWDGDMYCEKDYNYLVNTTCYGCKQPIDGRAISALGKQWHPECFVCVDCDKEFEGGKYFEKEGKAYCKTHYDMRFGAVCETCKKPISSKAVSTMTKQWHQDCFKCVGCEKSLAGGNFRDFNLKPMCTKCFGKLPSDVRKKAEKEAAARKDAENKARKEEEKAKKAAKK